MSQDKTEGAAYRLTCADCGMGVGDVRLVEHGTDDVALCKGCFRNLRRGLEDRDE